MAFRNRRSETYCEPAESLGAARKQADCALRDLHDPALRPLYQYESKLTSCGEQNTALSRRDST